MAVRVYVSECTPPCTYYLAENCVYECDVGDRLIIDEVYVILSESKYECHF